MKKLLVVITILLCGATIVIGNLHWNDKISAMGENDSNIKGEKHGTDVPVNGEEEEEVPNNLAAYSSNLPINVQEKIKEAVNSDQRVKLVIYGTSEVEGTWSTRFKEGLIKAYGEDVFDITILSTGDSTTLDIVNNLSYEKINELKPDVIIFEVPMLKDNGNVGIANTLNNVQKISDLWTEANEGLTLMLQPPNPLYSATYYPSEVAQLEEYAKKNNIPYLNHWENWPDLKDDSMKDYLTSDNKANEKGHALWSEFLINYFVAN